MFSMLVFFLWMVFFMDVAVGVGMNEGVSSQGLLHCVCSGKA